MTKKGKKEFPNWADSLVKKEEKKNDIASAFALALSKPTVDYTTPAPATEKTVKFSESEKSKDTKKKRKIEEEEDKGRFLLFSCFIRCNLYIFEFAKRGFRRGAK